MREMIKIFREGNQASAVYEGSIGRQRFDIPCNQLACLLEKWFTVLQIADIIGVSIRTVKRRMTEYDLKLYSQLTDQQLDGIVRDIQTQFLTCGNHQMQPISPWNDCIFQ